MISNPHCSYLVICLYAYPGQRGTAKPHICMDLAVGEPPTPTPKKKPHKQQQSELISGNHG